MTDKVKFVEALLGILVERQVISRDRAKDLQKAFGDSSIEEFEEFLVQEGFVESDELLAALSKYYDTPSFDVQDHFFETHLLREFSKDFLLRNALIPLEIENHTLMIMVAAYPNRPGLESAIRGFVSYDIVFYVGLRNDICDAVKEFYDRALTEVPDANEVPQQEREDREAFENSLLDDSQED